MGANVGFSKTSCGYVGYSDGWQDLHKDFQLDWEFDQAEDGNVAVIGEINPSSSREFTVGIAFGESLHGAVTVLEQSLATPFAEHRERFVDQWHRACTRMKGLDGVSGDGGELYRISRNLLLAHEDKTFAGALTRWFVRRLTWSGTGRPHSKSAGKRTVDIHRPRWRSASLL